MRPESPSEYLGKHVPKEGVDNEEFFTAKEGLIRSLGAIEYHKEGGRAKIENAPFVLEIEYEPVPFDDQKLFNALNPKYESLLRLVSFKLMRTDKPAEMSLKDLIPESYEVFFSPIDLGGSDVVYTQTEKIILTSDIARLDTIVGLLHEIGHIYEQEKYRTEFAREKDSGLFVEHHARQLLSERDAWAFAFKKLKPFFDREKTNNFTITREEVATYVKKYCLETYTGSIKSSVTEAKMMSHFDHDYAYLMEE